MQTKKLGSTATNVRTEGNATIVRYHDTDVVRFDDSNITLNTGGWFTSTTKARMNQASAQFGLGFRVYQEKGSLYIWYPFTDWQRILFPQANGNTTITIERRV